jgi:hypothetical protein
MSWRSAVVSGLALVVGCGGPETNVEPLSEAPFSDTPAADSGGTGDTAAPDDTDTLPGEYIYEEEENAGALLTPDDVSAALTEALGVFLTDLDPFLVLAAVDAAVSFEDAGCPYYYTDYYPLYGYYYWYGGCDTDAGTSFDGYLYGIHYDPFTSSGYYYPDYGWWYGDGAVERSDGQSLEISGYWSMYKWEYYTPASTYLYVYAYGEASWAGPAYRDTWLADSASISYTMTGAFDPLLGAWLQIDGGVAGLSTATDSLWFDGVFMATAQQGSSCPAEPSGTISVRDAAGEWYDVEFQGPAYAGAASFPPECDGCGDVWYRGTNIGQACPDLSGMTTWEGSPW